MGLKRVNAGVEALVKWVEKDRERHADIPLDEYLISLNVVREKRYGIFRYPTIKGTITYSKSGFVLSETSRSLYLFPPLISSYATSRTADMAERAGTILTAEGYSCEVEII
ncbi:MAG: hypothetical protein WCI72_01020 [archaeon]